MRRDETNPQPRSLIRGGSLDALSSFAPWRRIGALVPVLTVGLGGLALADYGVAGAAALCSLTLVAMTAAFDAMIDEPVRDWIKALAKGLPGLKARLAALLPHPDPSFDPFAAEARRAPRVREILLHSGPLPGGFYGREQLEGSAGLAWG